MHNSRIKWIDTAKAIGILLVVIGHLDGLPFTVKKIIYSFHMPLFFIISGYLFNENYVYSSFFVFLFKRIKTLLVPYYFFGVLSIPYFLIYNFLFSEEIFKFDVIVGFLLGSRSKLWINTALWFFMALFICNILFWILYKYLNLFVVFIALFCFVFFSKMIRTLSPIFCIDVSLYLFPFFCIGFLFRKTSLLSFLFNLSKTKKIICLFILSFLFYFSFIYNSYVDFFLLMIGSPLLTFVVASVASFFIFYIAKMMPTIEIFNLLSKDSVVIFPVHLKIYGVLTFLFLNFLNFSRSDLSTFPFMCIYFVIGLLFSMLFASFLRNKAPWAIGNR